MKTGLRLVIAFFSACCCSINLCHAQQGMFDSYFDQIEALAERDKIISHNIANADTPKFKPRELKMKRRDGMSVPISITNSSHMDLSMFTDYDISPAPIREIKPNGNAVNLEDELFKKSENSLRFQEALNMYNRSQAMLRTAIKGNK